jgi:hypothetical protein
MNSSNSKEHINLPEGPWGLSGVSDNGGEKKTHSPLDKKVQRNRRKDQQSKASKKANRNS